MYFRDCKTLGVFERKIPLTLEFNSSTNWFFSSHIYLYIIYLLRQIISEFWHYFPSMHEMFISLSPSDNFDSAKNVLQRLQNIRCFWKKNPINFRVQISPRVKTMHNAWIFPPISLLNISVYRLQPRLFIDSLPYLYWSIKKL
jgi:hypothetical protein